MHLEAIDLFRYQLPLKRPLYVAGEFLDRREGFLIRVTADGQQGWGDVAPLEGLSQETPAQILKQYRQLQQDLLDTLIPSGVEKCEGVFATWLVDLALAPSLQFGFESAVLNLLALGHHQTIPQLLAKTDQASDVAVDGLLFGPLDKMMSEAHVLLAQGVKFFKMKVGADPKEAAAQVMSINEALQGKAILHVDANQAWNLDEAVTFGEHIGCAAISYIEEPLDDIQAIPEFFAKTFIPVALDETLVKMPPHILPRLEGVDVFVLKPTMIGGVERVWQWCKLARESAVSCVISSSFESAVGLRMIMDLALSQPRMHTAGCDTLKFFEADLLQHPITFVNAHLPKSHLPLKADDMCLDRLGAVGQ